MSETGPPIRPEELRLLHAMIKVLIHIRNCYELDGVDMENMEESIIKAMDYFTGFMLQGIDKEDNKNG